MNEKLKELFFIIMGVFTIFGFGWFFNKVVNTSLTTTELIVFTFSAMGTCCIVLKEAMRIFPEMNNGR